MIYLQKLKCSLIVVGIDCKSRVEAEERGGYTNILILFKKRGNQCNWNVWLRLLMGVYV